MTLLILTSQNKWHRMQHSITSSAHRNKMGVESRIPSAAERRIYTSTCGRSTLPGSSASCMSCLQQLCHSVGPVLMWRYWRAVAWPSATVIARHSLRQSAAADSRYCTNRTGKGCFFSRPLLVVLDSYILTFLDQRFTLSAAEVWMPRC